MTWFLEEYPPIEPERFIRQQDKPNFRLVEPPPIEVYRLGPEPTQLKRPIEPDMRHEFADPEYGTRMTHIELEQPNYTWIDAQDWVDVPAWFSWLCWLLVCALPTSIVASVAVGVLGLTSLTGAVIFGTIVLLSTTVLTFWSRRRHGKLAHTTS